MALKSIRSSEFNSQIMYVINFTKSIISEFLTNPKYIMQLFSQSCLNREQDAISTLPTGKLVTAEIYAS